MKRSPFDRWSRSDPLLWLTCTAWVTLAASVLLAADSTSFDADRLGRFLAALLALLVVLFASAFARIMWLMHAPGLAAFSGAAPWLILSALAALFRDASWPAPLFLGGALGALFSTNFFGPNAAGYWLMLAVACTLWARHSTASTLFVLVAVAAVSSLGLIESNSRAVLTRVMWRRDRSTVGRPWFYGRSRSGLGIALVACLVLLATVLGVSRGAAAYRSALDERSERVPGKSGEPPSRESASLAQWMQSVSLGAQAARPTDEVLAEVAVRDGRSGDPVRDGRLLYFPVTTLDSFGADRMTRSASWPPELLADQSDGADDDWIEFSRPHARAPLITATVTQFAAGTARGGLAPLVRLEPLHAVRIDELSRLEDGALLAELADGRLEYALAADPRVPRLSADHRGPAGHAESRFLELPRDDPALERITARARDIVASADTDARRALALVAHFQQEFSYSEEGTGAAGCEGLARMLERRSGYCASIAAACVLMLRSRGIPARAVAGLLGSEFDAERGQYILRQRHGHAWVEAHFERLGWVRLDPTPPDAQLRAAARGAFDPLADWSKRAGSQLASFVRGDGDAPGLAQLATHLSAGPAALARSAREGQPLGLAGAAALLAAGAFCVVRWLRRSLARVRASRSSQGRALAFEERLIEALRGRGAQVRPSRTLREISGSAAARIEASLAPALSRAVRTLEAVRFGGAQLESEQRRELEALLEELSSNSPRA